MRGLPPRLMECAELVAKGHTEREIARRMGISVHTVHAYEHLLYFRLRLQGWGHPRVRLANWVRQRASATQAAPNTRSAASGSAAPGGCGPGSRE